MTTTNKLWLGFGTLAALLLLFSAALTIRLRSIKSNLAQQSNIARPRSDETRKLESNVIDYALSVSEYLRTGNAQMRQEAMNTTAAVDRHQAAYERLVTNDQQRALAARFDRQWQEFKQLGQTLLDVPNRQPNPTDVTRFQDLRFELETFLDNEMQMEAVATYNARLETTFKDVRDITTLALVLLAVGVVIAALTSGIVGRSIIRTEQLVSENRELLRVTLASIGDAVIATDTDGRVTFLNPVAQTLTGWTQAEAEGERSGQVFRIVNQATGTPVESPVERVLREGVVTGLANHTVLIGKDGRAVSIDDSGAPIRDEQGALRGAVLVFRDITEHKRADAAQQKLEYIFNHASWAVAVANPIDNTLEMVNPAFAAMHGYTVEELIGRSLSETFAPESRAELPKHIAAVNATGDYVYESVHLRKDGTRFPLLTHVSTFRDHAGHILYRAATFLDLTERKQAEDNLRHQERLLKALTESVLDGILIVSPEGRMLHQNQHFLDIWNFPADVVAAQSDALALRWAANQTADPTAFLARVTDIYGQPDGQYREELLMQDGRVYERFGAPVQDGETRLGWVWTFRDITERKRAERALTESEQRYRALANAVPDVVWTADPDGTITFASDQWFRYVGMTPDADAKYWPELVLHPDDYERYVEQWTYALQHGTDYEIEVRNRRHDGAYRWFLTRATPTRDAAGNITAWYGATTDITERKQAALALSESEARYRFIVENTSDGIWWIELTEPMPLTLSEDEQVEWYFRHAVFRQSNLETARMYGYASVEQLVGVPVREVVSPANPVNLQMSRQFVRSGYHLVDAESRKVDKDGRELVFLNNLIGIVEDGKLKGEWGTNRDITARKRAQEALQASEARFRTIFESATVSLWEEDFTAVRELVKRLQAEGVHEVRRYLAEHPDLVLEAAQKTAVLDVNPESLKMLGAQTKAELLGSLDQVFLPESLAVFAEELAVIAEGGGYFQAEAPARTLQGERREILLSVTFPAPAEPIDRVLVSVVDITERKQQEQAKDFIALASSTLSASLAFEATLEQLAQLAVPTLADWCAVHILMDDGIIRRLAFAHHDAAQVARVTARPQQHNLDEQAKHLVPYVLRTGVAEIVNEVSAAFLQEAARDAAHLEWLENLGLKAYLCIPLQARGRTLGTVTYAMSESGRAYSASDVELAQELAQRASLAADNAWLYQESQAAQARLKLVAEVSSDLIQSLDDQTRLAQLAHWVVPRFADWCAINLVQADGSIHLAALAHVDPNMLPILREWVALAPLSPDGSSGTPHVIRTGKSKWVSDVTRRNDNAETSKGNVSPHAQRLQTQSYIIVPLVARERVLGAITFAQSESKRHFTFLDLLSGEEIARRTALALENATMYALEQAARRDAEENALRISALQNVTAALAVALTPRQVAKSALEQGIAALAAHAGSVSLLSADGQTIEMIQTLGYAPELVDVWRTFPLDAAFPLAEAVRTGEPILLHGQANIRERYPYIWERQTTPMGKAWACVPLVLEDKSLGVLGLTFLDERQFDADDRAFLNTLAQQCAQALERARLYESEQAARKTAEREQERSSLLATISSALSSSLKVPETLQEVVRAALPTFGDYAVIDLVQGQELAPLAAAHVDPAREKIVWELVQSYHPRLDDPNSSSGRVAMTGEPALYPELPAPGYDLKRMPDQSRELITSLNLRSAIILPLLSQRRVLGVMNIGYAESGRQYTQADVPFAQEIARRVAVALENARLYQQEQAARALAELAAQRNAWLADASEVLASSLDFETTLKELAQRVVSELADWCAIDMAKGDGTAEQLIMAHRDPAKLKWAQEHTEEIKQYLTPDWDAPIGLPNVLRTGKPEIYYDIPDSLLEQVAKNEVQLEILRGICYSSSMIVPLNAQGKTVGALTMVNTDSRRHFTDDDLEFAELFAGRAAAAIENARLYREKELLNQELEQRVEQRTFELSEANAELSNEAVERTRAEEMTRALLRISNKLNSTLDVETSLEILIQEGLRQINGTGGYGGLRTPQGMTMHNYYANGKNMPLEYTWQYGKGLPGWVLEHAAPYMTNDAPNDPVMLHDLPFTQNARNAICTPILDAQNQVIGFFGVLDKQERAPFTDVDVDFMMALSPIASIAIENAQAYQRITKAESAAQASFAQLRALAARLQTIREEERIDIARELHDELGQALTALKMDVAALSSHLPPRNKSLQERAHAMSEQIDGTIKTVRRLSSQLRPGMLDDLGLGPSIEWYAQEFQTRTAIEIETNVPLEELELERSVATALYRIFQETLTNVARHAKATRVQAKLELQENVLVLEIADNGQGFDPEQVRAKRSLGLLGMRERAEMVNGALEIQGAPGQGATIVVRVPIQTS